MIFFFLWGIDDFFCLSEFIYPYEEAFNTQDFLSYLEAKHHAEDFYFEQELIEAKFLPLFHRKLSQKLLTDFRDGCIMYDNKSQRRSSHVYEQVLLLLLCYGLPDFCEIREVRSGFRNNKNTVSPHSSCRWGITELRIFIFS